MISMQKLDSKSFTDKAQLTKVFGVPISGFHDQFDAEKVQQVLIREIERADEIKRRRNEVLNFQQVSNCDVIQYLEEKD